MKKLLPSYLKLLALCSLPLVTICLARPVRAQENHLTPAPPPMKFVSSNERSQLSAARDTKARIRANLELAETRLQHAEEMTSAQRYDDAASDLGCYQGLMEDALHFLADTGNANKLRDLYKRLELSLRAHAPRLEAMRRTTPVEYSVNIKAIMDFARDARTEALNAFYGNTVLHENAEESSGGRASTSQPTGAASPQQPQNQP
ncbi:MAG TPA: hypothetical protein VK619_15360 [Pyrinomonadaceae bacterium]|nr:hypothetical protein [Pyrinomonadaceae bacterium]